MARGLRKHLKRVATPKKWYLSKLGGVFAPRPSTGPHKLRECLPLAILIRNRLKYALTYNEVKMVVMQRTIQIDNKIRTDITFPVGFMDVVVIEKTQDCFRMLYDTKGRFVTHRITPEEATYKLCRIKKLTLGHKAVPYAVTHDGRTLRYIHPSVRVNDVVRLDLQSGQVLDFLKFEIGNQAMVTGGNNAGRIGVISKIDKHPGSFTIVHLKDTRNNSFATRIDNVFVIGTAQKFWITLPKDMGIRKSCIEDRQQRLDNQSRN